MLTFGSLFAGIGGIDLGLERAGLACAWQVETDPYAIRILEKHWPRVRRHDDVRTFPPDEPGGWRVDCVNGGFPCQDLSLAGRGRGLAGERSGLWREFARIVRVLRPRYVLVENVPGLLVRGLGRILGDLAALGYDAEWDVLPAIALGAPHIRARVFILANLPDAESNGWFEGRPESAREQGRRDLAIDGCQTVPDAERHRLEGRDDPHPGKGAHGRQGRSIHPECATLSNANRRFERQLRRDQFAAFCEETREFYWPGAQSPVRGMADGIPDRVGQLRTLGNAVIPAKAEWYGRRILELEHARSPQLI